MPFNTSVNNRFYNQPVTPTATSYAAKASDVIIEVTNTAAARTITLPAPSATGNVGKAFIIKDSSGNANTNNITINTVSGLIDGTASAVITSNYGSTQVYCDGTNYYTYGITSVSNGMYQINERVITSSGTYTPTAGMLYCEVQMVGGGGAGGGAPATVTTYSGGGGGGAGEYAFGIFSSAQIGSSQTVTIGSGGSLNFGGSGGNGTATSLGSLMSANGGIGGVASSSLAEYAVQGSLGGTGGTVATYNIYGSSGGAALGSVAAGVCSGGIGASSPFGAGGLAAAASTLGGAASISGGFGFGYGSGGGGGLSLQSAQSTGGPGANGAVFIKEYIGGTTAIPTWTAFTTTVSATTTAPVPTGLSITSYYLQIGKVLLINFRLSATGGSGGSGTYFFNIPAGFTINTTITGTGYDAGTIGTGFATTGVGSGPGSVTMTAYDSTHYQGYAVYFPSTSTNGLIGAGFYNFGGTLTYNFNLSIPIN